MRRAFCLEANLNVKREMSESFGKLSAERQAQAVRSVRFYYYDLVARQPREPGTAGWQPAAREEVGQYSPPARSTQGHSRNADERETPEGARRGPEVPSQLSPHRVIAGAWEGQRRPTVAGDCRPLVIQASRPHRRCVRQVLQKRSRVKSWEKG